MTIDDQEFDRKARQLYRDAVHATPPAVRQQLRTTLQQPRARHWAWQPVLAFASVALFALGGLWLQPAFGPAPVAPATTATVQTGAPAATSDAATTSPVPSSILAYDNDPEFYAWLGNDTATGRGK